MRLFSIIWLVIHLALADFAYSSNFIFPRTPAPSPDGQQIAFSFQGDIWIMPAAGGQARCITGNPGYDYAPKWSPDGRRIAFSSDRYGNDDVFVIDLDGGSLRRLTFFTNPDVVQQWSPDGQNILFGSRRDFYYHRNPLTYQVPVEGGTPFEVIPEYTQQGRLSPDGQFLLFVRGRVDVFRKGYRGSSNTDIFIYDFKKQTYRQLTEFEGNDLFPLWGLDGKLIYFVSERDGVMNLWQMNPDGSQKKQLTFFKEDGIRYPEISADGAWITFERLFDIYRFDVNSGRAQKIELQLPVDYVQNPYTYQKYSGEAREMAISADGKEIAFVIRGEIFVINKDGRFLNQITQSPWRDEDIDWYPGRDTLAFVSDRAGNRNIYLIYSDDPQQRALSRATRFKMERLTASPRDEFSPRFSPDGRWLAYVRGKGDLIVREMESGREKTVISGWSTPDFSWSPDGQWLAYSIEDEEFNRDVYLHHLESGKRYNISQHPDNDYAPAWSKDGRRLAFISRRIANNTDVWMVFLRKEDDRKTREEWEEYFSQLKEKKKGKKHRVQVKIDEPQKLFKRLRRVTSLPGSETEFCWSPDGQFVAFKTNSAGKSDLWKVKWDGSDLQALTRDGTAPFNLIWQAKNKRIYFLKRGGKIASISPEGKDAKSIKFSARLRVEKFQEQRQKFNEAWRTLNERFYDPQFHGADWQALYQKYFPAACNAPTLRDFNDIVRMMLGELNASHLGISPPKQERLITSGMLGVRFDAHYAGPGLKIKEIIPNGPCDAIEHPLQVGDVILKVRGYQVGTKNNLYAHLENRAGKLTELTVTTTLNDNPHERRVLVKPVTYSKFMELEYDRWREEKRTLVRQLSQGRLGYIHIRAMGLKSLEQFEMELYAEGHGKEGLIIDVRNNGGGWIADYLLNMLEIKNHAVTIPRDGGKGYPQSRRPLYAWTKPIAVLCNEYSYSNAEIFAHAIKTLKRGKVIGVPTGGLVISTGSISLIDGSAFRVPFRGWYVIDNMMNMENHGAVPDIIVKDLPGDVAAHKDRQLETAVQVLLKE
ncbi:peptidase S41 [Caldithrix abyssi DSM 13497]|uniref:Tricorn protease homolog n=1 Tax=Caldithrix abyssi DSM 13497 TaxID=880073 RepID=H1XTR5_CALAY|nr:S41 family peptidase [Caldithrix abyssi]APF18700.1 WD40-like Beta Propeller Repeat [Caldithrix abyssi DSM 13497]EHO42682.1 peptidase S41 [Caldithrix abyssi DSM 13497]